MLIKPERPPRLPRSLPWLGFAGLSLGALVFLAPSSWGQPEGAPWGQPTVEGNLSVAQVEQAMFADPRAALDCYGTLPQPRPTVYAHYSFEIDETGHVSSGRASAPSHPELEPCLHAALMTRVFPAPSSGRVSVEFPTKLTPPYPERRAFAEGRYGNSEHLPPEIIKSVVRGYFDQFRACYEPLIPSLPAAGVTMSFTIGLEGNVTDGEATPREPTAAELAACVEDVMHTMQFPAPEDGVVTVDYPIMFDAGGEGPPPAGR